MSKGTIQCPECGKEHQVERTQGTTNYHGKKFNNGALILDRNLGLMCKECFEKVNEEDEE